MIIVLASVGYVLVGLAVGWFVFNDCEKDGVRELQQEMRDAAKSTTHPRRMLYAKMDEDELFEAAYNKIKDHGVNKTLGAIAGIIWPAFIAILLTAMAILGLIKGVGALLPKSSADKKLEAIKTKRKRKEEWSAALRQMEDAGVDTKELRKMDFE